MKLLHRSCFLIFALLTLQVSGIAAANDTPLLLSEADCAAILENNGVTPKSIPTELVDSCKNAPAIAPAAAAIAAAPDPCSGADAAGSVYCWGPWVGLAPAAGGDADAPVVLYQDDFRPELAAQYGSGISPAPPIGPDLPLAQCIPGASCGFATVVSGTSGVGNAADTEIVTFSLASDGSSFVVAPGESNEIQSVPMTPNLEPRGGDNYILDSSGAVANGPVTQVSQLQARVTSTDGVNIVDAAADYWANASIRAGIVEGQSGNFVHGTATTLADLDQLRNLNASVNFSGPMSVDNGTTANITVNYAAASTWTGSWSGNYAFDAGGTVNGADFVSVANQFSNNVAGGYVQGAVLGPAGNQSAAVAIDVTLNGIGNVKDVGLLQHVP